MNIKIIYANNSLRNYNYVISCPASKEAIVIDPLATDDIINCINQNNLIVNSIINTHEHWDHVAGNKKLKEQFNVPIYCHPNGLNAIPEADHSLSAHDTLTLGKNIQISVLDTPGHTLAHLCLLFNHKKKTALFCGDTLFNAGCGNCYNGGDVEQLYNTFSQQLINLPNDTLIYPGHDYIINNLEFTLSREPSNIKAKKLLEELKMSHNPSQPIITTLALEKSINAFFRLNSPEIKTKLNLSLEPSDKDIFIRLRELRNEW